MNRIIIIVYCFVLFIISFTEKKDAVNKIVSTGALQIDSLPGASPYFTKDNKDNTVLSWVRIINDSTAFLSYRKIKFGGSRLGETITIPASRNIHPHSENLPKILFKPTGEIIAVWGVRNPNPANRHSGLIYYSQSFDEGKTWSEGRRLVKDTAGYDQRYSDIALLANGEAVIIWLDNRKSIDKEGSALYSAITEGNNGFQKERLVSQPACQCCRTRVFVDNRNNIHAIYRGVLNDSIRDMVHVVSEDGGKTFSSPKKIFNDNWVLKGCPHTGPAMTENKQGLHFAWFTGGVAKGSFYIRSADNGKSFMAHDNISQLGMHPQLSSLSDGGLVIVWDESVQVADKYNKRIGLQLRTAEGVEQLKEFITSDTMYSTYPVVSAIEDNAVLVAYSSKENGKEYVKWQRVGVGG